jgi:colicin import membrane protein
VKAGLSTSVVLHATLLGFGLFSLSAPRAFEVADVEALPVSIIPMESLTQIQKGDKKATLSEKPAPLPTKRPDDVPDAREVGENKIDTDKPPTPETKPTPMEATAAPPPAPEPKPQQPVKQAEVAPAPKPEPKPATPATEVAALPAPKEEVKPDPVKEAIAAEPVPTPDAAKLPDQAPAPQAKPQPPKAETAKAPERKEAEKPVREAAARPKSDEKQFNADEVSALLNKAKAAGGGAKRSTEQASLGGDKTKGAKLSQSEMDALSTQLAGCWALPGAGGGEDLNGLRVSVRFNVDASGKVEGSPRVEKSSGNRNFDESALRAVRKCDRAGLLLPKDKSDTWAEIVVNFDPSQMLF